MCSNAGMDEFVKPYMLVLCQNHMDFLAIYLFIIKKYFYRLLGLTEITRVF